MTRMLKALGLAALAVLAMSALGASPASAAPEFHLEMEDTTLTGSQVEAAPTVLKTDLGEMKCNVVKVDGTMGPLATTTMTLKPTYEECKIGAANATVTLNGCRYVFHLGENTETFEAGMGIECPEGQKLVIHIPFCSTTIPPQGILATSKFTNEGAGATRSVIADLNVGKIDYIEHGFMCPNETVTTNNGVLIGQITIKGENAAEEHKGIWVE